jgi:hypothetical protein
MFTVMESKKGIFVKGLVWVETYANWLTLTNRIKHVKTGWNIQLQTKDPGGGAGGGEGGRINNEIFRFLKGFGFAYVFAIKKCFSFSAIKKLPY